jgi:hypothetical protein
MTARSNREKQLVVKAAAKLVEGGMWSASAPERRSASCSHSSKEDGSW